MEKLARKGLIVLVSFVFLVFISHLLLHLGIFYNFIRDGNYHLGSMHYLLIRENFSSYYFPSMAFLGVEFSLLLFLAVYLISSIIKEKRHIEILNLKEIHTTKNSTDLDVLYAVLRQKKKIGLDSISDTFKLSEEVVKEWASILEDNGLAKVVYPHFREPVLVFTEKEVKDEKK